MVVIYLIFRNPQIDKGGSRGGGIGAMAPPRGLCKYKNSSWIIEKYAWTLRRVEDWIWSGMVEDRLNGLALMHLLGRMHVEEWCVLKNGKRLPFFHFDVNLVLCFPPGSVSGVLWCIQIPKPMFIMQTRTRQ